MVARTGLFTAPVPGSPPVGTSPTDGRLVLGGLFGTTPKLISGGAVTQSGTTMQFTLAQAVWQLPDTTNAAAVFISPTDQTVLTPAAGPATGSRVDSVIVKQNNFEAGDADSRANAILLVGAPGAPGLPAALPAGYYRYADITVPATAANAAACTVNILSPSPLAPGGRVIRSATPAVPGSGWTVLNAANLWAVDQTASGIGTFNGVWTCTQAGVYDVEAGLQIDGTVNAIIAVKKNNVAASNVGAVLAESVVGTALFTGGTVKGRIPLIAGDTLALAVFLSSSAPITNSAPTSFFGLRYVEPAR